MTPLLGPAAAAAAAAPWLEPEVVLGGLKPQAWAQVMACAQGLGVALYLVGGSVRDHALAQRTPGPSAAIGRDVDLVVEGDALRFAQVLVKTLGGSLLTKEAFGTARWTAPAALALSAPQAIDIAMARAESYAAPAALPTVRPASITADLGRRDFSINAMARGLNGAHRGLLLDPWGGMADLQAGVLRVLHAASFVDDPTRMWRAARFAARMGLTLAPSTETALRDACRVGYPRQVSVQRLGHELDLLLAEGSAAQAIGWARAWQLGPAFAEGLVLTSTFERRLAASLKHGARLCALVPVGEVHQRDMLWLELACCLRPSARLRLAPMLSRGRRQQQRFLHGPDSLARAARVLREGTPMARSHALAQLDRVELLVLGCRPMPAAPKAHWRWWCTQGHAITTTVDGRTLTALGFSAGPDFKAALAAALEVAWQGGDHGAQCAAAVAVLRLRGDKP